MKNGTFFRGDAAVALLCTTSRSYRSKEHSAHVKDPRSRINSDMRMVGLREAMSLLSEGLARSRWHLPGFHPNAASCTPAPGCLDRRRPVCTITAEFMCARLLGSRRTRSSRVLNTCCDDAG